MNNKRKMKKKKKKKESENRPQNGRKYLQIRYMIRDLHPDYIKNSYNSK
jgi:hypothetical protein